MKIGIFGGSFNPIHSGHLIAAEQILEKKICDKIWFMPCYRNPLKKKLTETKHIKRMLELALENSKFELSEFELKKKKTNYTIETMKELKKKFPEYEFYFIIGSKALKEMHKWKQYKKLLKETKLIIILMPGFSEIPKEISKFHPIKVNPTVSSNISSTTIRKKIKEKKDVSIFLQEKVLDYIKKNKLYLQ
jgi:nicotinate-nucleotide adenylyltransferase